ncbi:hypothetical protein H9L25_00890 [Terrisporobacter mayombei]|nr:hypothetical protein [Terrisporobacter mayombei]
MSKKISYDYVKTYIESFNYKLIENEYINNSTKMKMKCDKGHDVFMNWANFKTGKRCRECANEKMRSERKLDINIIREYVESFGYSLETDYYKNSRTPLDMRCDKGHNCSINWDNFKYGRRCKKCNNEKLNKRFKLSYDYVKNYIESFGFKLKSKEYINYEGYLKMECSNGHVFNKRFSVFRVSHKCPICGMSKGEEKIKDFLNKNNISFHYDKPYFKDLLSPLGNPLRPDFILPDLKIWIEYDGEFHFKKMYDDDNYDDMVVHDKIKNEYAQKHNWIMIRIPYWDFNKIETILNKELII